MSPDGRRCKAEAFLELHHEVPFAMGGESTVENIRLVCRLHNGHLAERDYGAEHMARYSKGDSRRGHRERDDGQEQNVQDATSAMRSLGFSKKVSREAVGYAVEHGGKGASLETLIRLALARQIFRIPV